RMSVLDELLSHASRHTEGGAAASDFSARRRLCLVTCSDPRLTRMFSKVLGLERGDAVVIRVPGAGASPELVRAVASAVLLSGCDEVLVLTPTSGVHTQTLSDVLDRMSARGVQRNAIPGDVRAFFGLQPNARQAALDTAALLRSQPFLPKGVLVHAALIDPDSGALTMVERGENAEVRTVAQPATTSTFGSLPEGLGLGIDISRERSSVATLLEVGSGAVELDITHIPPPDLTLTPLDLTITPLQRSNINLTPKVRFGMPAAPEAVNQFVPEPFDPSLQPQETTLVAPGADASPASVRPPSRPAAAKPPRPQQPAPARPRAVTLPPALAQKIEPVRAFFFAEVTPAARKNVKRALTEAYESGEPNAELVKVAIKPILELGQKRYKVIDELIALKEAAGQLDRETYFGALMQLIG
ncbi:MAG: hypothetical protein ACK4N5_22915, partial [Myxococcales bacterium]